ncbi:RimK family alpha-L-glutamate ligase [Brachybacterium paraconglomeratum]|uniref:RimK family alpha-L-glutamate ligase n=1 Tax=Brachybacterium paraconglomeratum TaxID=173362 RepID=UPI003879BECF
MTRIGIVTTSPGAFTSADPDRDCAPLVAALRDRGVEAASLNWHDASIDWASWDLAVLRSPWDYAQHPAEFAAWLELAGTQTHVLNEPELVRWNMDKHYLLELEAEGIPVIPTTYHRRLDSVRDALAAPTQAAHVVVKPAVGAGSQRTGLFAREDPAALALARQILDAGGTVMLQPEVPELSDGLEKAVYTLDGRFTHAVAKGALLARGGGLRGGQYQENPQLVEASADEQTFAERVLAAVAEVTGLGTPLYGRIDLVDSAEHGLVLIEAELFEPTYNLHLAPEVTKLFVDAILGRVRATEPERSL